MDFDGDLSVSLYSALKINLYCEGYWSAFHKYINLPSEVCTYDSRDRIKYALRILKQAAFEVYSEDKYPPAVVFDNVAQILKSSGTEIIHLLQDVAKQVSDERCSSLYLHL